MPYPIIDAHQHFWKYDPRRDGWITSEMSVLRKDYLPSDLEPLLNKNQITGSVVIQSDPSENENAFQLHLAAENPFIKGVVGWVDLQSDHLEERLSYYRQFDKMKGFREILQGDKQRDRMLHPAFLRGMGLLNSYGFSYDLLILPDQLPFAEKLVAGFPEQRFIIDHLAKPAVKRKSISEWKASMRRFSGYPQVFCKISGMITEADWEGWHPEDFRPYMDTILEIFGPKRIMFGSDWPVCLLAGAYEEVKQLAADYFSSFSTTEQADFFGANATIFYKLK